MIQNAWTLRSTSRGRRCRRGPPFGTATWSQRLTGLACDNQKPLPVGAKRTQKPNLSPKIRLSWAENQLYRCLPGCTPQSYVLWPAVAWCSSATTSSRPGNDEKTGTHFRDLGLNFHFQFDEWRWTFNFAWLHQRIAMLGSSATGNKLQAFWCLEPPINCWPIWPWED